MKNPEHYYLIVHGHEVEHPADDVAGIPEMKLPEPGMILDERAEFDLSKKQPPILNQYRQEASNSSANSSATSAVLSDDQNDVKDKLRV